MYSIHYSAESLKGIQKLSNQPKLLRKLEKLLEELKEHPYTGTGHPEQLRFANGLWSRRIDKKHRLRYSVEEDKIMVFIVSVWGHYDDK